ncbi:MAG: zinc ribbon domain-containing protein, partial [Thermoplasmata archaeon]
MGVGTTHGDLVVTAANSPYIITSLDPDASENVYYEQGNITVETGGTLEVVNTTLSFVSFVSQTGNITDQYSHLYHFTDLGGTILFNKANLTTDVAVLGAYPKLNLSIENGSTVTVQQSTFEYPGWLYVDGTGTTVTFVNSTVTANPLAQAISGEVTIAADSSYSPTLWVGDGANFVFEQSSYLGYYSNSFTDNGIPGPPAMVDPTPPVTIGPATPNTWDLFQFTANSSDLVRSALYPTIAGAVVTFSASTHGNGTASGADFDYNGVVPITTPITFSPLVPLMSVPLPAAAIASINANGIPAFLAAVVAHTVSFTLNGTTGNFVNVSAVTIQLIPAVHFDLEVANASITAVDSTLDINWTVATVDPWESTKLILNDSATAYLANVSTSYPYTNLYTNESAVLPDPTSQAYFYRWLVIPVVGAGGAPVTGALATVYYAYDTDQANNHTAAALNDLGTTDPVLAAYAASVARTSGDPSYGASNGVGQISLLVATSWLNSSSLPDGVYLGTYHVGVTVPSPPSSDPEWIFAATVPYPQGMYPAAQDMATTASFPSYVPSPPVQVNYNVPTTTVVPGHSYSTTGQVLFKTAGPAIVSVSIVGAGYGAEIGSTSVSTSGAFSVEISVPSGTPSGSYEVMVSATAGGYTGHANYTSALSVGSAPTSSGFFNEKIVGLPLWILFVIIGIVIVAIVTLMVVLPRMSRGKLVECGECGELIPESATQCPKCGAEFESELVRCSRCGSTIPANSKVCPECAAQLLGNPGDTENDPERQGYEDFVERYRLAAKKDLGDNFSEGAFWDWWKRQVTYLSFSQWRLQQSQGPRSGMSAPPADNRGNEPEVNMVPPALSGSRAPGQVSAPPTGTPATAAAGAPPRYTPPAGSGP